ncbi:MAG: histidine kinase [Oscillospiraceae bacterium]|nr:histidine kinase [Oscillospiraceae bacterium]
MQRLIDKLLLLGLCLMILSFSEIELMFLASLLTAVAISSFSEYFENILSRCLSVIYLMLCILFPKFIGFLPLIVYDMAGYDKVYFKYSWVAIIVIDVFTSPFPSYIRVILISCVALLLHYRTQQQIKIRNDFFTLTDKSKEYSLRLERKNQQLMDKQDYELRLATLSERNRIAREIHDNVGHLLTRSILQVDALNVTYSQNKEILDELHILKSTMSEAMSSVRNSVHNLHDESLDLRVQMETICSEFEFCSVSLRFEADNPSTAIKYCFIAVTREALSNIAQHSDATNAYIIIEEHPAFCTLSIQDNGRIKPTDDINGIGLRNMSDRVEVLGGIFRSEYSNGFKIFISVPKEHDKA